MAEKHPKNFILLCGRAGAGKTTVANILENDYGYRQVRSYTTRPRRTPLDSDHIFVSEKEFDRIPKEDMVAYAEFGHHRYCATKAQVEEADIYVVDPEAIKMFKQTYDGDKNIRVVLFDVPTSVSLRRMNERGHSWEYIWNRLKEDIAQFDKFNDYDYAFLGTDSKENLAQNLFEILKGDR